MTTDISWLFDEPKLNVKVLLTIQPLAPLSMVNSMPGSYYKTERVPTKFMLCGLFENVLGFHFSHKDRMVIRTALKRHSKRNFKCNFPEGKSPAGYLPLVHHLFDIEFPFIPQLTFYEDLWTQHLIGADERHLKGVINYDWELESEIVRINNIADAAAKSKARNEFFIKHQRRFPFYYRSPQRREFLIANGSFIIKLHVTRGLFSTLQEAMDNNNVGYLGTSEGWVHLLLKELR